MRERSWRRAFVVGVLLALCRAGWAAPVLEVDRTEWRMGKVPRNETRTHVFTLRNTGDEPLIISQIRPSCKSCLGTVDGDKTLNPGESRPLRVTYRAVDAYGQRTMSVTIHSNDPVRSLVRLRLSVEVVPRKGKPILTVRPVAIDVAVVPVGRPTGVNVVLANEGDAPLEVRSIVPSAGCRPVGVFKDAVPPGGELVVPVQVLPRTAGVIQESIGFETNDPERPTVVIPIEGYAQPGAVERERGLLLTPRLVREPGRPAVYRLSLANMSGFSVTVTFPEMARGRADAAKAAAPAGRVLRLAPGDRSEGVIALAGDASARLVVHLVLQPADSAEAAPAASAGKVAPATSTP